MNSFINSTDTLLKSRRTIHEFDAACPPWDAIEAALDTARFAPNHYFTQPWRFFRVGPGTKAQIVTLNAELVTAKKGPEAGEKKRLRWSDIPGWLVVTCQRSPQARRQREDYAACCCAIQNLAISLWARGIGLKWTTGDVIRDPRFYALLGIKRHQHDVVGLLWYGYPLSVPRPLRSPLAAHLSQLP